MSCFGTTSIYEGRYSISPESVARNHCLTVRLSISGESMPRPYTGEKLRRQFTSLLRVRQASQSIKAIILTKRIYLSANCSNVIDLFHLLWYNQSLLEQLFF